MNRDETKKLLMRIQTVYPNWKPQADLKYVVDVWNEYLLDYSYEQALMGLKVFIMSNTGGFAPSIGQLIDKIHIKDSYSEMGEMEAWAAVRKALSNGSSSYEEEYRKLPKTVQKAVGDARNIFEWSRMDIEIVNSVIHSNFLRNYRAALESSRDDKRVPERLRLDSGEGKQVEMIGDGRSEKEDDRVTHDGIPMPDSVRERYMQLFGNSLRAREKQKEAEDD